MLTPFKNSGIESTRLILTPINANDASFVLALFNTKAWLKYIGDRNIHSERDAEIFISNATNNTNAAIWTIREKENVNLPLGIITLIKRDYLTWPDVGFALMPNVMHLGFAYEASKAVIDVVLAHPLFEKLSAITLEENLQSIKLLKKLGFTYEKEIHNNNELLHLYML